MISFENVTKAYGDLTVLDDVTEHIEPGGMTALIGPNGAGKSTMLTIAGRLLDATSGVVTVEGKDVATTKSDELARMLAILRQENHVTARLRVFELVTFGRFPHSKGRITPRDEEIIDSALDFLSLRELKDRFLDQLSGGQRQRAFVAMVLAQDTDYVLLDEPLNNLDMKHSVAMMRMLRRAATELGKTIILVIHDVNFAAAYVDRIIGLRDGRILHSGSPLEIMRPEILSEIFDVEMTVHTINGRPTAIQNY